MGTPRSESHFLCPYLGAPQAEILQIPSAMSRRRLYPPYGWPTSQRHERHQAAEESSWTTSEINSKRCQIGESTGESTERVRSLQRTGLALGRGGLNFGTAENNCKTKPARARLWHSTVACIRRCVVEAGGRGRRAGACGYAVSMIARLRTALRR